MLVSIITPLYNSEVFLEKTFNSIRSQTYSNWEWIVVDDFSSDTSFEMIKKYKSFENRIKAFQNKKNEGAAISRNRAIMEAKGRFIAFLDSDDLWTEDKLEKQIAFMLNKKIALSYSNYRVITESGEDTNKEISPPDRLDYQLMLKENQIGCLTAIYDKEMLGKCYMPLIRKRQDYGLWLSILKKVTYAYKAPGVSAFYRTRNSSISSSKINLLKYNYKLFREVEGMSTIKSIYYLSWNIYRKLTKK